MKYPNLISTSIHDKDLNEILGAINFINEKLPDLITVSELEKSTLYKTKSDTIKFVLENLKEAEKNPELVPANVDIQEIRKDMKLIQSINKILQPIHALLNKLEDSKLVAGSEAYLPSLAIYNAIKAKAILTSRKVRA
jgi:hypothetical protein